VKKDAFTHGGGTPSNGADSGVVTIVFPATGGVAVPVTDLTLTGKILAPVNGGEPVREFSASQYTGEVSWDPAPSNNAFGPGTAYKATVTLTAASGHTFTGVKKDAFTHGGGTPSNDAGSGTGLQIEVTIVFPKTTPEIPTVDLTGFIPAPVTGAPPKTEFVAGTYFGTVGWIKTDDSTAHSGLFEAGTGYTAKVTLYPAAGYVFPASVPVTHEGTTQSIAAFAYKPGADPGTVSGTISFDKTQDTPVDDLILTTLIPTPEEGETAVTKLLPEPPQYTGTVEWKETNGGAALGEHDTFTADTEYTATVTLTAKPGYTFAANTTFIHATTAIPANGAGKSVTVTIGLKTPPQSQW
jgi:hypothetical protein